MIKMLFMALSNSINIYFIKLNHPMSMMMFIITQTLLISWMTGSLMESFWLSYILLLTFLGGMLVLFIYITSIASNEMFKPKLMTMIMMIISLAMFMIIMIFSEKIMMDYFKNSETMFIYNSMNYQEMTLSLENLYNKPMFIITLMMMMYLFLTLMVVVKITNINQGPIRKMK